MSYQKLTIVGYAAERPELKYTSEGTAVCNISVAVNKKWTDSNGTQREQVTWYRVACWRKQAEIVAQYVTKGKLVLVEADTIKASGYTDRSGNVQASLEVTASTVRFLGGKSDSNGSNDGKQGNTTDYAPSNDTSDIPF